MSAANRSTFRQRYNFLFPGRKIYALALVGVPVGLAYGLTRHGHWLEAALIVICFLLLPAIVFIHDLHQMRHSDAGLKTVQAVSKLFATLGLSSRQAGYARIAFGSRYALSNPVVNSLLNAKEIPLQLERKPYRLPEKVQPLAPFLIRNAFSGDKILFNEPKLRLATDLTPELIESGAGVILQHTDYFSGLLTNDLATVQIKDRADKVVLSGSELVCDGQIAYDLADSPCSNHLGVSALAFTSDGHLVLTQTSARSAQNAGQLTPAASGSVSPDDLKNLAKPTLQYLAAAAIERELREEIGLTDRPDVTVNTRLVGYARFLNRSGKPELYGVSVLGAKLAELKIETAEKDLVDKIRVVAINGTDLNAIANAVQNLLEHGKGTLSPALYLNLTFFSAALRNNRPLISKLLGTD